MYYHVEMLSRISNIEIPVESKNKTKSNRQ